MGYYYSLFKKIDTMKKKRYVFFSLFVSDKSRSEEWRRMMSEEREKQEHERMHALGIAHTHTHTETKAVLNRMSKIIGHMESIKTMVENGRDCSEVLIQLAAVKSAIGGVSRVILKDHIDHCIVDAAKENDVHAIEELKKAIDKFI